MYEENRDEVDENCSAVVFEDASKQLTLTRRTLHRRAAGGHLR